MKIDDESCVGYIYDMTKQLAHMARGRGMDHFASLLEIAALEARAKTKTRNGHGSPHVDGLLQSGDASSFLREQSLRCTQLARDCPHPATAHRLEAFAVELTLKAADLEKEFAELR